MHAACTAHATICMIATRTLSLCWTDSSRKFQHRVCQSPRRFTAKTAAEHYRTLRTAIQHHVHTAAGQSPAVLFEHLHMRGGRDQRVHVCIATAATAVPHWL